MTIYQPLTKIITDEKGNEKVSCRYYGTEKCRSIHTSGCNNCPMFGVILNQLNTFETIYMEEVDGEEYRDE